jgi:hypothetical protein
VWSGTECSFGLGGLGPLLALRWLFESPSHQLALLPVPANKVGCSFPHLHFSSLCTLRLLQCELVSYVIFINVAYIPDGFLPNVFRDY